jgi:hypothetical protein
VLIVGAVMMMPLLAGCEQFPLAKRIGVSLTGGQITINVVLCAGQLVSTVTLVETRGDPASSDDDRTLWEIRSDAGSASASYVVGEVPEGFVQTVALERSPEINSPLATRSTTLGGQQLFLSFERQELQERRVLNIDDELIGIQEFAEAGRESCPA